MGWQVDKRERVFGAAGSGQGWESLCLASHFRGSSAGQTLGDLGRFESSSVLLPGPGLGIPDLQVLPRPDYRAWRVEAGVLDQRFRQANSARRVERFIKGAAVEATTQTPSIAPERTVGARNRSESCSNSSVVCNQTQGSKPLERTTPSAGPRESVTES